LAAVEFDMAFDKMDAVSHCITYFPTRHMLINVLGVLLAHGVAFVCKLVKRNPSTVTGMRPLFM